MSNLAVIIPFYKGERFIERCIESLEGIERRHIYVVDNSPESFINSRHVSVINSEEKKIGFGAAVNHGFNSINQSDYEYILVLNQDAYFRKGDFMRLLDYLKNNSCSKFLSPMIYSESFEEIMPFIKQRYFSKIQLPKDTNLSSKYVDIEDFVAVSLVIPILLMKKLNGFDTDFFMYYEDTDLIARANLDKPVRILANIHVAHFNPDLKKSVFNAEKEHWIEKSRLLYLKKHKSGVIWRIACIKSGLRKLKNAIFASDLRNKSQN